MFGEFAEGTNSPNIFLLYPPGERKALPCDTAKVSASFSQFAARPYQLSSFRPMMPTAMSPTQIPWGRLTLS